MTKGSYKPKTCAICGDEFVPNSGRQTICTKPECAKERRRRSNAKYAARRKQAVGRGRRPPAPRGQGAMGNMNMARRGAKKGPHGGSQPGSPVKAETPAQRRKRAEALAGSELARKLEERVQRRLEAAGG